MRKGLVVLGISPLIISFLALLFSGMLYSKGMATLHSLSGQIGLSFANQTEISLIYQTIGILTVMMIFSGIVMIVGAVTTAFGFRGKSRKERRAERESQSASQKHQ